MRDFETIKRLVGETVTEEDLRYVDCYAHHHFGVFIPFADGCGYAKRLQHTHPSYMIVIYFAKQQNTEIQNNNYYFSYILSPDIPHVDDLKEHSYYCILVEKEYFETEYRKYADSVPHFVNTQFQVCRDILKSLNLFAFEYSKEMVNSDITLEAQATILTHWIIRSIIGESYDMRAISDHYAVARAQHFIEQHYAEKITAERLAALGNVSVSSFNRIFRKQIHMSPIEYLIEIRLQQAKKMLRRSEIPITQVALNCGFGSNSHFSSRFQSAVHMTPSDYRKLYCER